MAVKTNTPVDGAPQAPAANADALAVLFDELADHFTLYSRMWRRSLPTCNAAVARRMKTVLARFAAKTRFNDKGSAMVPNEHPGSPDTRWGDAEDAAIALIMTSNSESPREGELIDYFALREGAPFVVDALARTFSYRFHKTAKAWSIIKLPKGAQGGGALGESAWEHLQKRMDEAGTTRGEWLPSATALSSPHVLSRCTFAWALRQQGEEVREPALAVIAAAGSVYDGPDGPDEWPTILMSWVSEQLKALGASAVAPLASAIRELMKARRADWWFTDELVGSLFAIGGDAARAELEALRSGSRKGSFRSRIEELLTPKKAPAKTEAKKTKAKGKRTEGAREFRPGADLGLLLEQLQAEPRRSKPVPHVTVLLERELPAELRALLSVWADHEIGLTLMLHDELWIDDRDLVSGPFEDSAIKNDFGYGSPGQPEEAVVVGHTPYGDAFICDLNAKGPNAPVQQLSHEEGFMTCNRWKSLDDLIACQPPIRT